MNAVAEKFYGNYKIPEEIYKLYELNEELNKQDLSLGVISLHPATGDEAYSITPPDVIPFASTGGAGIHFGFLTDFGRVASLADAPIVCVTPTDYPPIRFIARNLQDFFNLVGMLPHAELLETLWANPTEDYLQLLLQEMAEYADAEWEADRSKVLNAFKQALSVKEVNVAAYLKEVQEERLNAVAIRTLDGLGVMGEDGEHYAQLDYPFEFSSPVDEAKLAEMKNFLAGCGDVEKRTFVRDAFYSVVLTPDDEPGLFAFVVEMLKELGCEDEVVRVLGRGGYEG